MVKKKTILHIANYFIPDAGYQENQLMRNFSKINDAEYSIVSVAKNYPIDGGYEFLADVFVERGITPGKYIEEGVTSFRLSARFEKRQRIWLKGLYDVIREVDPDAIVVHGATNLNTLRIALHKKFFAKKIYKLIVDDHIAKELLNSSVGARWFYFFYRTFFANFLSSQTDVFIPCTKGIESVMKCTYGLKGDFQVIEHGSDHTVFYPSKDLRDNFRSLHNVGDSQFLILYTGRIIKEKKVGLLIDVFAELQPSHPNIKLMIIGYSDTVYLQKLKNQVRLRNLDDYITFSGPVKNNELGAVYNGGDLVVWPDGITMSSIESCMCGLPSIMRNLPVNAERVNGGKAGVLFDSDIDLLDAVRRVIEDDNFRDSLSTEGLKYSVDSSWLSKAANFHKISID